MATAENSSTAPPTAAPVIPAATPQGVSSALYGEHNGFRWYHVADPAGPGLGEFAKMLERHELAVEDCRTPDTRAKIDEYGDTLFLVANLVRFDAQQDECSFSEMDFFLRDKL